MSRKPAWAALNIHHADDAGRPVFIEAGQPIPDWVDDEMLRDWIRGGAATYSKPKGDS